MQEITKIRLPSHWSQVKSSTEVDNVKLVFQIFVHCIVHELLIIFILWLNIKLLNFCLDYLMGVKWHLLVILICIFFITNEVEPLLHMVIEDSFLLWNTLWIVAFSLLISRFFYILGLLLWVICFANSFSQSGFFFFKTTKLCGIFDV